MQIQLTVNEPCIRDMAYNVHVYVKRNSLRSSHRSTISIRYQYCRCGLQVRPMLMFNLYGFWSKIHRYCEKITSSSSLSLSSFRISVCYFKIDEPNESSEIENQFCWFSVFFSISFFSIIHVVFFSIILSYLKIRMLTYTNTTFIRFTYINVKCWVCSRKHGYWDKCIIDLWQSFIIFSFFFSVQR